MSDWLWDARSGVGRSELCNLLKDDKERRQMKLGKKKAIPIEVYQADCGRGFVILWMYP